MKVNPWLTLECLGNDHESCLGRNCSTEQSQVCECKCHLAKQEEFQKAIENEDPAVTPGSVSH